MQKLVVIALAIVILQSCYGPSSKKSMQNLGQLEGKWMASQNILFNEQWEIESDTLFEGLGYSLQGADTAFAEELKIFYNEGEVFYAVKVGNSDTFINFKLEKAKRNSWVFENGEHDYPNIISYKINGDELVATTTNSNGNKKIEFKMKRITE